MHRLFNFFHRHIFLPNLVKFELNHHTYNYFSHLYNTTWVNERAVEVPIIKKYLDDALTENPEAKVLEIGNVLAHYYDISHQVVDKYEQDENVINEDIISYKPKQKFDLIISISTLEHVGWDEYPRKSTKTRRDIKKIKRLLKPGGKAVITIPLGYNHDLDNLLKHDKITFTNEYYLKRISVFNTWQETGRVAIYGAKYGWPFQNANELLVAEISK
jgi:SAM-dependent methyltransferase